MADKMVKGMSQSGREAPEPLKKGDADKMGATKMGNRSNPNQAAQEECCGGHTSRQGQSGKC